MGSMAGDGEPPVVQADGQPVEEGEDQGDGRPAGEDGEVAARGCAAGARSRPARGPPTATRPSIAACFVNTPAAAADAGQ